MQGPRKFVGFHLPVIPRKIHQADSQASLVGERERAEDCSPPDACCMCLLKSAPAHDLQIAGVGRGLQAPWG
jgi:hypothetical protein